MQIPSLLRACAALVLCLTLALPALPQYVGSSGPIGASKGEIAGAVGGGIAAIVVVGVLVYHETHKHPSLKGCVASDGAGMSLASAKDKKVYVLSGDLSALKDGEQFTVKGKKSKDAHGKFTFQVEQITKSLGPCH